MHGFRCLDDPSQLVATAWPTKKKSNIVHPDEGDHVTSAAGPTHRHSSGLSWPELASAGAYLREGMCGSVAGNIHLDPILNFRNLEIGPDSTDHVIIVYTSMCLDTVPRGTQGSEPYSAEDQAVNNSMETWDTSAAVQARSHSPDPLD